MKGLACQIVCASSVVLIACSCATLQGARGGASVGQFVVPYNAVVYLSPAGGSGAASTELGLGTSETNHVPVFQGLPGDPQPAEEVRIGEFARGTVISFSQKTRWRGRDYWAFSSNNDVISRVAFQDVDNSLGFGRRRVIEQIAPDTWIMHMDDAASFLIDDNDTDIRVRIRLGRK